MAIQTNSLGPNSAYIVYTSGETPSSVCSAVWSWVQNHGWELHDNTPSASSKVFKALCADVSTYKYVMIGYDASGVYMRIFEEWNAGTHVGTNETWYGGQSAVRSQRVDTSNGGYMYLFASQRYCVMFARTLGGEWGASGTNSWSGCFELSEDSRDTRTLPPFGYMDGYNSLGCGIMGQRWGAMNPTNISNALTFWFSNYGSYNCFSLPKNIPERHRTKR